MAPPVHCAGAMFAAVTAVVLLAAMSALHCAAMCGPLSSCASQGQRRIALRYQLGRLVGYSALGAAGGALGSLLLEPLATWLAALAAWTAAAVLLVSARRSWTSGRSRLVRIRPRGRASKSSRLIAILTRWIGGHPLASGALTALLPCGVLWAAVAISLASGSAIAGAAVMAIFAALSGVATTVAAIALAAAGRSFGARGLAVILALSALVFVALPLPRLVKAQGDAAASTACPLHAAANQ